MANSEPIESGEIERSTAEFFLKKEKDKKSGNQEKFIDHIMLEVINI